MIEVISFSSTNPGSHTLVLWSIHGNEVCWSIAIDRTIEKVRKWEIQITSGQVTFLPRANRDAYDAWVREIEYNLNRLFWPREVLTKEHQVAKLIERYIQQASFVLDLHSIHEGEWAFAFQESPFNIAEKFIAWLPVPHVLLEWEKLYWETTDMDTVAYATTQWIPWVTVECGNHTDPKSIKVAEELISHALRFFGHTKITEDMPEKGKSFVRAREIIYRPNGARFSKDWKNFDIIRKGEIIWISDQWNHYAPYDGVIIIPKPHGTVRDEWYYLGTIS